MKEKEPKDNFEAWYLSSLRGSIVLDPTKAITGGGSSKSCNCGGNSQPSTPSYSSGRSAANFNATSFSVGVAVGALF